MGKWRDASEIMMVHDLPDKKLRELDREMRQKPNFNKSKIKAKKQNIRKK